MLRMTVAAMLGLMTAAPAPAADGDAAVGVWRNLRNTMHIQVHHCGESMCGKVVWANEEALNDSKRGGNPNLIGTEIFQDFRKGKDGVWRGKVFVPDINKTFSGTIALTDPNTLKGTGCLVGRVFCKSKILVRMDAH